MNPKTLSARLVPLLALGVCLPRFAAAQEAPPKEAFQVLEPRAAGPRMTPFLRYQLDLAWRQEEERQRAWEAIRSEGDLRRLQEETRQKLLEMIGGLPAEKTALNPQITGKIQMKGYAIEKLIFESLPGVYVTALVYSPDDRGGKHPAVLVPAGHAPNGKIHYQGLSQRLVSRGYWSLPGIPSDKVSAASFGMPRSGRVDTT